jgi:hypothetical protein
MPQINETDFRCCDCGTSIRYSETMRLVSVNCDTPEAGDTTVRQASCYRVYCGACAEKRDLSHAETPPGTDTSPVALTYPTNGPAVDESPTGGQQDAMPSNESADTTSPTPAPAPRLTVPSDPIPAAVSTGGQVVGPLIPPPFKSAKPAIWPRKLGPNASCFCGSRRKYKKCCGLRRQPQVASTTATPLIEDRSLSIAAPEVPHA